MLRSVDNGDQKKFTKNPRHFFNAKLPGKFEEKIHKSFLDNGQSNEICREKNSGHFQASFPEERGATHFHQKCHGIFHGNFHAHWQWEQFLPQQVLLSKNFRPRPVFRQKFSLRNLGLGVGVKIWSSSSPRPQAQIKISIS